jgi:microcystin-dependent protein
MSQAYIGEIRLVGFGFAPKYWMLCQGQTLPISQNQALFAILGTQYGGNGSTTFQLPDMRGRIPVSWGGGTVVGQTGGNFTTILTPANLPAHVHQAYGDPGVATSNAPTATSLLGSLAAGGSPAYYSTNAPTATMSPSMLGSVGGNQPLSLMQPYIALTFAICIYGIFPSRN